MRKILLGAAALATFSSAPLVAQGGFVFGVNGGVAMPMGDLADAVGTGWGGGVQLMMRNPDSKIGWGIDTHFGRFGFDDVGPVDVDASLNAYGAMARLDFSMGGAFYLLGGAGLFRQEVTSDDEGPDLGDTDGTDFAVQGGLGLNFSRGLFAEAKFVNIFTEGSATQFVPITVGIRF
jgi:hypothetical protein